MPGKGRPTKNIFDTLSNQEQNVANSIRPYLPNDVTEKVLGTAVEVGATLQACGNGFRWRCLWQNCGRSFLIGNPAVAGEYDTRAVRKHWRNQHKVRWPL